MYGIFKYSWLGHIANKHGAFKIAWRILNLSKFWCLMVFHSPTVEFLLSNGAWLWSCTAEFCLQDYASIFFVITNPFNFQLNRTPEQWHDTDTPTLVLDPHYKVGSFFKSHLAHFFRSIYLFLLFIKLLYTPADFLMHYSI